MRVSGSSSRPRDSHVWPERLHQHGVVLHFHYGMNLWNYDVVCPQLGVSYIEGFHLRVLHLDALLHV